MDKNKLKEINEGIQGLKDTVRSLKSEGEVKDKEIARLKSVMVAFDGIVEALGERGREREEAIKTELKQASDDLSEAIKKLSEKEYPTAWEVSNLKEVVDKLDAILIKETPEYPKEIKVSNLSEIKLPKDVKVSNLGDLGKLFTTGLTGAIKAIRELGSKAFNAVVTGEVKITNKEIEDAIPVRLASKDLRFFYDALTMISSGPAGSGGGTADQVLLNQIITAIEELGGSWYDTVTVTYPAGDTEVYTYTLAAVTVRTITVVYTDGAKTDLLSVTKT